MLPLFVPRKRYYALKPIQFISLTGWNSISRINSEINTRTYWQYATLTIVRVQLWLRLNSVIFSRLIKILLIHFEEKLFLKIGIRHVRKLGTKYLPSAAEHPHTCSWWCKRSVFSLIDSLQIGIRMQGYDTHRMFSPCRRNSILY